MGQSCAAKPFLRAPYPVWRGEDVCGKRVVVYEEQGLGDIIQFCRYLALLAEMGAAVTFLLRSRMHALIRSLGQAVRVSDTFPVDETFDYQCALLSLPLAFGTTVENIPARTPYLQADAERIRSWKQKLGDAGFKIGIAWQGSKTGKIDVGRSFALAEFAGVSRIPNIRLISLQKNEGVEQLRDLPEGMTVEDLGENFDSGTDAFVDTAAVMANLDLVISSDTSAAHLAGALGRPVWLALKHVPDWRWMLDRTDSPWYPTMRLFRQRTRGDWNGVFADIEMALREAIGSGRRPVGEAAQKAPTPRVPVSWGEVIDRITILEIKDGELVDEIARANVKKELNLLQDTVSALVDLDQISTLKADLKAVNIDIWKTEDIIREKESSGEFDQAFVELARSVYRKNDQRSKIKRQINSVLSSEIL